MRTLLTSLLFAFIAAGVAQITITPLPLNTNLHGVVNSNSWAFYSFDISANKAFHLNVEHGSKYDLDVFVRKGSEVPTRTAGSYDYTEAGFLPNITLESRVEPAAQHYVAGIYGFRGDAVPFAITVSEANGCPGSCSNHGTCLNGKCFCNSGYSGEACDQIITPISVDHLNGPYVLQKGEWKYFSIYLSNSQTVEIFVEKIGTLSTGDVDFYIRRNQPPTLFEYDYSDLTKFDRNTTNFSLNISAPQIGMWYIGTYGFETSQFQFTVRSLTICPNDCSLHGTCIGASCSCVSGYVGAGCNDYRFPITIGTLYQGYVSSNAWNYYLVQAHSMSTLVITVDHPNDGSNCDLYVNEGQPPTLTSYSHRNVSLGSHMTIELPSPAESLFHVGIFGYSSCTYTLKATLDSTKCNCGTHGQCLGGRCVCQALWAGEQCQYSAPLLSNGATRTGTVANGDWQYFTFNFHSTHQFVAVMHEEDDSGHTFLYAQVGTYPTLDRNNIANRDTASSYHRLSIRFLQPYTGSVYFGVYRAPTTDGRTTNFKISGTIPTQSPLSCLSNRSALREGDVLSLLYCPIRM